MKEYMETKMWRILLMSVIIVIPFTVSCNDLETQKTETSQIKTTNTTIVGLIPIPNNSNSPEKVLFYIKEFMQDEKQITLTVVKEWSGTGTTIIEYDTNYEPYVLNVYGTKMSSLAGDYLVSVTATDAEIENRIQNQRLTRLGATLIDSESVEYIEPNIYTSIIRNTTTGKIAIRITAVGYSWHAMLGKE
jgi:hypothetical protein